MSPSWANTRLLLLALACLAQLATSTELAVESAPWFCHDLDCPKYKVLETTDAYETREYKAGVWASTEVESYAYALAVPQGFRRLFKYIDGGNAKNEKIPMTSPVLVKMEPSSGPFCKSTYTISFFVPFDFQDSPPEPEDSSITITHSDPFTAYVAQSGGFKMDDFTLARMVSALTDALDADGVEYDSSHFFFAGYDPPFRISNRHNEVWIAAKEDTRASGIAQE